MRGTQYPPLASRCFECPKSRLTRVITGEKRSGVGDLLAVKNSSKLAAPTASRGRSSSKTLRFSSEGFALALVRAGQRSPKLTRLRAGPSTTLRAERKRLLSILTQRWRAGLTCGRAYGARIFKDLKD